MDQQHKKASMRAEIKVWKHVYQIPDLMTSCMCLCVELSSGSARDDVFAALRDMAETHYIAIHCSSWQRL